MSTTFPVSIQLSGGRRIREGKKSPHTRTGREERGGRPLPPTKSRRRGGGEKESVRPTSGRKNQSFPLDVQTLEKRKEGKKGKPRSRRKKCSPPPPPPPLACGEVWLFFAPRKEIEIVLFPPPPPPKKPQARGRKKKKGRVCYSQGVREKLPS